MKTLREDVFQYAKGKYKTEPEYLWRRFPHYAVLRHEDNRKWYGLIMDIPRENLGLHGEGRVDILNVKLADTAYADMLIHQKGYFKGYHISRGNWVSVLLDGTVPMKEVQSLLAESYAVTSKKYRKTKERPPKEWLVPANPKHYDVIPFALLKGTYGIYAVRGPRGIPHSLSEILKYQGEGGRILPG